MFNFPGIISFDNFANFLLYEKNIIDILIGYL